MAFGKLIINTRPFQWLGARETAAFDHIRIVTGKNLTNKDQKSVLLGELLAANIDKKVGDTIQLADNEIFQVVGTFETTNVLENGSLVISLKDMQRIMDKKGMITGFSIIMDPDKKDPDSIAAACSQIQKIAHYLHAQSSGDFVKSRPELQLAKGMAWLTSLIALLIGTFGMMNTMVMSIHERTKEIGTRAAVGYAGAGSCA